MPIDPQAKAIGEQLGAGLDFTRLDLAAVRAASDAGALLGPRPEVAQLEERAVPGPGGALRVRVYTPEAPALRPGLLYFHGGGWALCSLDTHDATCRQLANGAGCTVVSVDYRLAPEHKYPAAAEDAYAATCWLAERAAELGVDAARIGVAGDSAGGNLAAVVALMARDRGGPALRHQLLVYPVTDHSFDTDSYRENAAGPLLTREMMQTFWSFYLADPRHGGQPYASPLRAESLAGLPPATLITAECDPLRDEGEAYGARLAEAGVRVVAKRYAGMIHGFFAMDAVLSRAKEALDDAIRELRAHL
jgi:acetyl esterase